jgi:hypothetical protein
LELQAVLIKYMVQEERGILCMHTFQQSEVSDHM